MKIAIINIDLDFFTKPYYKGNHYEESDWTSMSGFKSAANKWMRSDEFVAKIPYEHRIRGVINRSDETPIFSFHKLIKEGFIKPKEFEILHFDAHSDMYIWNNREYYESKKNLAEFHPFDSMLAPLIFEWVDKITWIHPDYVVPQIHKFIEDQVTPIAWSDFSFNDYDIRFLSVVTNPDIAIVNEGMVEDFQNIMQIW